MLFYLIRDIISLSKSSPSSSSSCSESAIMRPSGILWKPGGENTKAIVKKATRDVFGNTNQKRQDAALARAELETLKKPENISLDDMQDVDLPEGKGIDFRQVIDKLPDDAKTLIGNLRADYTRKTQELANQRKQLESEMKALTESEFFSKVKERAEAPDVELDPYNTDSFNQRIEQEVARRLQEMYEPVRQQQELQMRQLKLQEFKTANPDLETYKNEVAQELKKNPNISLQDAYYIVKGRDSASKLRELEKENLERKALMRENGLKIAAGKSYSPNRPPKGLKGFELYQWFERQKAAK